MNRQGVVNLVGISNQTPAPTSVENNAGWFIYFSLFAKLPAHPWHMLILRNANNAPPIGPAWSEKPGPT